MHPAYSGSGAIRFIGADQKPVYDFLTGIFSPSNGARSLGGIMSLGLVLSSAGLSLAITSKFLRIYLFLFDAVKQKLHDIGQKFDNIKQFSYLCSR